MKIVVVNSKGLMGFVLRKIFKISKIDKE